MFISISGCFFSTAEGELRCYENPKNKITAEPAPEEEIWGAKFKVCDYQALFSNLDLGEWIQN